jgi:hypothetical protein
MTEIANQVVIAFCALLVVWYVVGWQMNRRRGESLLTWILQGLRAFGDQITVSRLGTSGFQVNVGKVQAPFKKVEATILLQPREIFLLWIFNRLRGGGDHLVLKAILRASPRGEVEVIKRGGRGSLDSPGDSRWPGDSLSRREGPAASGGHCAPGGGSQPAPAEGIAQQESPSPAVKPFPGWAR